MRKLVFNLCAVRKFTFSLCAMRKLVFVLLAMIITFTAATTFASETGANIVYLDAGKIFDNSKEGTGAQTRLRNYVDSRQRIIDLEEQELKILEDELKKQKSVLSPDALMDKEALFQKKFRQYRTKVQELTSEIQAKKMEVLKDFNTILEKIVAELSEKNNYDMVIDKNPELGMIVYGNKSLDITDKVLEFMNK